MQRLFSVAFFSFFFFLQPSFFMVSWLPGLTEFDKYLILLLASIIVSKTFHCRLSSYNIIMIINNNDINNNNNNLNNNFDSL